MIVSVITKRLFVIVAKYYQKENKQKSWEKNTKVGMVCESLKACIPQYGYKRLRDEMLPDGILEYEIVCIPSEYL